MLHACVSSLLSFGLCTHCLLVPPPVHQVPWKEVVDRWKTVRQRWSKTLKVAETPQQIAGLMAELHEHLRTDKSSGVFATGGSWELQLMACARGEAGMTQLVAVWDEMKAAIQVRSHQQYRLNLVAADKSICDAGKGTD